MKSNQIRNSLIFSVIILFIFSSLSPMAFGNNTSSSESSQTSELERQLEDLAGLCTTPNGFNEQKYNLYKEQLLNYYSSDSSNDDEIIVPEKEKSNFQIETPLEPLSIGPMNSAWPMQNHDVHHTGQSTYSTADNPYDEKWKFSTDGWIEETPVIGSNGTIYFGGSYNLQPWYLFAINPDGKENWKYKTGGLIWSSPAIAEDGTIYIGSWDSNLYAINSDGTLKWKFPSNNANICSSPVIAEDGTIYFGDLGEFGSNSRIYAVNPNGTLKWDYIVGDRIYSDPCIGDDGTVYIGSDDTYLYAMNPDGTLKWRFKTDDCIKGPPSINEDGIIYVGSYDDYLYALYPNGTMKWRCAIGYGTALNPSMGLDGTIYTGWNKLYAVNSNGTIKWSFNIGTERHIDGSSPAVSADGTIYFGTNIGDSNGGEIIAVNPDGTERWRRNIADSWVESSPSIGEDGTVYIGSSSTYSALYAFGIADLETDTNGPYYGLINHAVQFTGSAYGGYKPYSFFWEFGDSSTSYEQNPQHTYTEPGNYTVTLTVTDNNSNTVIDTTYAWIQESNTPPNTPDINGPNRGKFGVSYPYTFVTTDPDASIVWYFVDWGDNSNTGWLGPYDSGVAVTKSHTWDEKGSYTIQVKAKDPYNAVSSWGTFDITMPRNRIINIDLFLQFLQNHPYIFPLIRFLLKI